MKSLESMTKEYIKKILLSKSKIKHINNLCLKKLTERDFDDSDIGKFSCFFVETVIFDNGFQADIKACTGDIGDSAWTEMVLFDNNGFELCCTDVSDEIDGEWKIEFDDDIYIVNVIGKQE